MRRVSVLVFEILEKVWQTRDCALIDMKIEFGVDDDGKCTVLRVITNLKIVVVVMYSKKLSGSEVLIPHSLKSQNYFISK